MKKRFVALFALVLLFNGLAQAGPGRLSYAAGTVIEEPTPPPPPAAAKSACPGGGC